MSYSHIEVTPLGGSIGAEISGMDLTAPMGDEVFAEVHDAFLGHLVLFFHDQALEPRSQHAFAKRFGEPARYPFVDGVDGFPEVTEIVKDEHERENFGGGWHSDTTYTECPPMATCLHAKRVPAAGGDTLFANMYLAHETLSDGMKSLLDGLKGVSSAALKSVGGASRPLGSASLKSRNADLVDGMQAVHPLVRTHPETGRKTLYLNSLHTVRIDGMREDESRPILDYLFRHIVRPEFTCRFRWRAGSLALWDNRAALHNPINDYHGHRRVMHRVTITGDRPF